MKRKRFTAIPCSDADTTLNFPTYTPLPIEKKFMESPFGSGKPLHAAFHMCLLGVGIGQPRITLIILGAQQSNLIGMICAFISCTIATKNR